MEIWKSVPAGSKLCMLTAPMFRARAPIVADRVSSIFTPGKGDTGGIAVNPRQFALRQRLADAGLPVVDIQELKKKTERLTGKPKSFQKVTDRWQRSLTRKVICKIRFIMFNKGEWLCVKSAHSKSPIPLQECVSKQTAT